MKKKRIALLVGTRPEAIKLAPLYLELKNSSEFETLLISTGQHREMLDQALAAFCISTDLDLKLMQSGQELNDLLGRAIQAIGSALNENQISGLVVQGDTTSALSGALASFHLKIPVAHVEAGLRTGDKYSPFPEEMNRVLISRIASLSFAPTSRAATSLQSEGISENVFVTGNTVVDAALLVSNKLDTKELSPAPELSFLERERFILVTGHRRENFDTRLKNLCVGLRKISEQISDLNIVYPVHLNPNVQKVVHSELGNKTHVHLLQPVDYPSMLSLIKRCALIVSDSGGIQEEAPTFGKRVIVTRESTERPELLESGLGILCSLDEVDDFVAALRAELNREKDGVAEVVNPFGDGKASVKIKKILEKHWRATP